MQTSNKPVSTDRRAVRTRAAITQAFMHLLETTPYSKITISAIAREADINRKTFYLHYHSVENLLRTVIYQSVLDSIESAVRTLAIRGEDVRNNPEAALRQVTLTILKQLAQSPSLNKRVVENVPTSMLLEMAVDPMRTVVNTLRKRHHASEVPNLDYLLTCYLGSIIICYREWNSAPAPKPTLESIGETICSIFASKARELL